jgi:predicted nucleotidyltransferase
MPVLEDFSKVLRFFDSLKSEKLVKDYAIIGGLALSAWIKPRATRDIDLLVSCSGDLGHNDLKYLVESRLGKKTVGHTMGKNETIRGMFSFNENLLEADVISAQDFPLAEEAIENAVDIEVLGQKVKIATPEYIIALKLIPFEEQWGQGQWGQACKIADR